MVMMRDAGAWEPVMPVTTAFARFRPRLCPRSPPPCRHRPQHPGLARPCPPRRHLRLAPKPLQCGIFHSGSGPIGGPRSLRGGSWNNQPARVRSANRNRNPPTNRNNNVGFRLASPPADPEPPRPRRRRARCAGDHESASGTRRDGSAK